MYFIVFVMEQKMSDIIYIFLQNIRKRFLFIGISGVRFYDDTNNINFYWSQFQMKNDYLGLSTYLPVGQHWTA